MLPLSGFSIGITGHRRSGEQAEMLIKRGAKVQLGPVIESIPLDDIDATIDATNQMISAPVDHLVLTTGLGTRSWTAVAESAGIDDDLRAAVAGRSVLARGPKARSAAIGAGIEVSWQAPGETSVEILDHLRDVGVAGRRIAVQRDGGLDRADHLIAGLEELGAEVIGIPVYRWRLPDDVEPARRLVASVTAGRMDAVTFTSAIAAEQFFQIGSDDPDLARALSSLVTVAVGPVTAGVLRRLGVDAVVEPERARLGAMVQTLVAHLNGSRRTLRFGPAHATWQGSALVVGDGEPTHLTSGENRMLRTLVEAAPAVVPKLDLVDDGVDAHAAEVAVARLRTKLGPLGRGIRAVPRRGYRCEISLDA